MSERKIPYKIYLEESEMPKTCLLYTSPSPRDA